MPLENKQFILASNSPRRLELLKTISNNINLIKIDFDESFEESQKTGIAKNLAFKKLKQVDLELYENDILICADTIVVLNNNVLGKPVNHESASDTLKALSGAIHTVATGVAIKTIDKIINFEVSTEVSFNELTENEISYYINNFSPFDKAGSYGIQDWIGKIGISKINGCYYNVMGLPISTILTKLKENAII